MKKPRRVVVTGMAWLTALGDDLGEVWEALLAGRSGLRPLPFAGRIRNYLAAPVAEIDAPPAERLIQMACGTMRRALQSAGREGSDTGLRLVMGTSLGAHLDDEAARQSLSGWATSAARELGNGSAPVVISTACSSGSDAISVGAELIRSGDVKCCVCGGADILTDSKRLAHTALGTMSPTELRAFDVRHDGTLLGEGAGFLVLESEEESHGRSPLAILRGSGLANDATGMTLPDCEGRSAGYAIARSLADAGLATSEIGLINAHGSGTPANDTTECNAYRTMFASEEPPLVFATKGNFGHSLGATGAIEAMALILALRAGVVPPITRLEQPLPEFTLPLPAGQPVQCKARLGLSLTLGFGGFNTSLIFEVAA